jgi:N6-adenosine-specific RNA methylase IME4
MRPELFEDYLVSANKPSLNGAFKHAVRARGQGATAHTAVCSGRDLDLLIQEGVEFRTILADPPWQYSNQATRGATDLHYPTMGTAEIAAMPIEKLAADVAQLHLWATTPLLPEAFKVIEAWGFEYKSCMVWLKPWGTGSYWRVSQEFLLLATRGEAQFPDGQHNQRSWREAPKGRHSEKPEEFRELVEAVSQAPRLELFARKPVAGWTVWGDEIEADRFHKGVQDLLDDLRDEEEEVE